MTLANYRGFKRKVPKTDEEPIATVEVKAPLVEHDYHPEALEYIQIGAVLAAITAIEVVLFYISLGTNVLVTLLLLLSGLKFVLVIMWFMHLKFDAGILTKMFIGGIGLAFSIFMVMIATLGAGLL